MKATFPESRRLPLPPLPIAALTGLISACIALLASGEPLTTSPTVDRPGGAAPHTGPSSGIASADSRWIHKKGKLSDLRDYEIAGHLAGNGEPGSLDDLKVTIGGLPFEIPRAAWTDLRILPDQDPFSLSNFAGEMTLHVVAQGQSQPCVANIRIRDGRVVERETTEPDRAPVSVRFQPPVQYITGSLDPRDIERLRAAESPSGNGDR